MFYCDECKRLHNFPESIVKSHGRCELCDKMSICNDVPSKMLPKMSPRLFKFILEINLGNDKMRTDDDIADALRSVADNVKSKGSTAILDVNGNVVGHWGYV